MPQQTWAQIQPLCSIAQVQVRVRDLCFVLQTDPSDTTGLNALISAKILDAGEVLRQELIIECAQRYPTTVKRWAQFQQSIIDARKQRSSRIVAQSGINGIQTPYDFGIYGGYGYGYGLGDNISIFMGNYGKPRGFALYGPPVNGKATANPAGSFAGIAENGSVLTDSLNENVYINRGEDLTVSNPTVTWAKWREEDMPDYILNPTILVRACAAATIWLCWIDGRTRGVTLYPDQEKFFDGQVEYWRCQFFDEEWPKVKKLLQIDPSGDGVLSDYDRFTMQSSIPFA